MLIVFALIFSKFNNFKSFTYLHDVLRIELLKLSNVKDDR
jgi:hypothetical protein